MSSGASHSWHSSQARAMGAVAMGVVPATALLPSDAGAVVAGVGAVVAVGGVLGVHCRLGTLMVPEPDSVRRVRR